MRLFRAIGIIAISALITACSGGGSSSAPVLRENLGTQHRSVAAVIDETDLATGYALAADSPNSFAAVHTTLRVPAKPPATGTLFLWPGLQPFGANFFPIGNGVLQPVLTWGPSCAPGKQPPAYTTWWISAQYVNTDGDDPGYTGCQGGPIMSVNVGDDLEIAMTLSGTTWNQKVTDTQTGKSVSFAINMQGQAQNFLYFFIEGYGQFPVGAVLFFNTTVTFATVPSNSCTLTTAGGASDPRDSFSKPVVSHGGLQCSISEIKLYSPDKSVPALLGLPAPSGAPPIPGGPLRGRRTPA
jgi:hypothetical protein